MEYRGPPAARSRDQRPAVTPAVGTTRVVIAPPVAALLPVYAGLADPIADLRASCQAAVDWLLASADGRGVRVAHDPVHPDDARRGVGSPLALRVATHLVGDRVPLVSDDAFQTHDPRPLLVMANGSARRGLKAPGHLDQRAFAYDDDLAAALAAGDTAALAGLDLDLAAELLTAGAPSLARLASFQVLESQLDYDEDPFGVRYWVVRWTCAF